MLNEWKQKIPKKIWKPFHPWLQKVIDRKRFGLTKGPNLLERSKSFVMGIKIYSTISETRAAFVERTIRSLKNILYRYMEDFGYKYIHELPQFITTLNSRRNSSIDIRPNTVKICDFMSILYSKPLREYKKPTFKIGHRVRISKYDLTFRKGYKPQFTQKVFEIVAIATKKQPTYTIKDEQDEIIQGIFHPKELIKVI